MDPRVTREEGVPAFTGRAAYAISQTYYYAAAAIGVIFLLGGSIAAVIALRGLVYHLNPQLVHQGPRSVLNGLAFALTGGLVAWWHLREVRTRAGDAPGPVFWGGALYAHVVALFALIVAMAGTVIVLMGVVSLAFPVCVSNPVMGGGSAGFISSGSLPGGTFCLSTSKASAIGILDGVIVLTLAGVVWFWHLRQGRTSTAPAPAA